MFSDIYSVTSTSPLRQFAEEKRRRSHCSTVSTPNLPVTVSPTHQTITTTVTLPQQLQQLPLSQKTFQSSSTQLSKIEEKIQGRGMCRSSASYGIQQMLQDQVGAIIFAIFPKVPSPAFIDGCGSYHTQTYYIQNVTNITLSQ